jgi:VCBS repeat-containing protein
MDAPQIANDSSAPHTLVVIDKAVANWQQLAEARPPGSELLLLDTNRDGTQQIAEYLEGRGTYDSVHVISHGSTGQIILGNETLNVSSLNENSVQLKALAAHLTRDADILIYGCDVAAGANGSILLTQLAALTGADLAASIDATGSASKGGNWVLEQQTGLIESSLAVSAALQASYDGLLAAPAITDSAVTRSTAEDNTLAISGIVIADSDGGNSQTVTINSTNGKIALASTASLTSITGNGTSSISFVGSAANATTAINGMIFTPDKDFSGTATFNISTNDGTTTVNLGSKNIAVTANATAPVLTLPATSQTVSEDTPTFLNFAGVNAIVLTDADPNDIQTLTLNVAHGTLNVTVAGGASITSGNGTASVVLSGTAAQLSATLASITGLQYSPALDYSSTTAAPEALSFSLTDGVAGHNKSGTVAINVTPTNDIPAITSGTPLSVSEGGTANFAAAVVTGSGFTQSQLGLTDADSAAVQTIVKISGLPSQGVLKLNGNPVAIGSTFSVADIANLSYTQNGTQVTAPTTDTFLLTYDDGAGGLVANKAVTVNLTPVNQAPTVSGSITVIEGETGVRLDNNGVLPAVLGGGARGAISVGDPEGASISTYTITSLPSNGTLLYDNVAITAPFVVSDISKLTYNHNGSNTVADSFNISVTDNGGGTGVQATSSGTVNLSIYPNDDDPVLATNVTQTLGNTSSSLTITSSMLGVTDTDSPASTLTYTLTNVPNPADGYFKLAGSTLTAGASFTQADIDAGRLVYVSRTTTPRTDSISFTVKDGGQRILPDVRDGGIYDTSAQNSPLTVNTFSISVPSTALITDPSGPPSNAPINTAPTTGGSNVVSPLEGETVALTTGMLGASDADNVPAALIYRLHTLPSSGSVTLNNVALLVNQTFTQLDVNSGYVRFAHAGGEDFFDTFTYSVSDGKTISSVKTFNITTTPQNDTPTATTTGQFLFEGGSFNLTTANITLADADNSTSDNETGYAVNNALSFLITGTVANGTLKLNGADVTAGTTIVTSAELAAGKLVYQHNGSEKFTDSFKLVPVDDKGITAGTATATNKISTGAEVTVPITIYPLNDAPSKVFKSQLIAGEAGAIQEGATATIGGASSYATINGITGSGTPTPTSGAHLVFGDNDNSSVQRQYRVTQAPSNGLLSLNGAALGVGSTFTQADLDSGKITYKHSGTETSTDSFKYVVSDGDYIVNDTQTFAQGAAPEASTFLIDITPRNDAPTLSTATTSLDAFASGAGTTAITGISLADPDLTNGVTSGETDFVRVEVQVLDTADVAVTAAQLSFGTSDPSGGNAFVSGKNSNSLIVQGTKAQVDAILSSLTIAFSADTDASNYKIRITADDRLYNSSGVLTTGANGGPGSFNADGSAMDATNNRVTKDITLRASNFNDLPTISNASAFSVNEDAQLTLTGFSVADADSFGEDVTVTVRLYSDAAHTTLANISTQGVLKLGATTGLTATSGNNTNTITLTGSVSEVQAALNDLKFAGAANFNGTGVGNGSLYLRTTVADFSHADGQKTATVDNTITLVPVNDQPTLSVPGTQVLGSGTSITISSGFIVGDAVDIAQGASDYVEVTVAATLSSTAYGTISVTPGAATVANNGTATIVVKGTSAAVQTALNSMVFTPANANANGSVLITTTVDDRVGGSGNGNGKEGVGIDGNNNRSASFNINISASNDAPVLTAPTTLTISEDSSANAVSGISFVDNDDFGASEKVTLDLGATPKGTITLTTITGLTFTTGDGTSDTKMVFTGTKAAINAALATLKFTPTANLNTLSGNEQTLSIIVDDQGNTGAGGVKTDSKNIAITITPVNDAPTRTAASVTLATAIEDSAPAGVTVNSLFAPVFSDVTDTQTGGSSANSLAGVAIVGNASTAAQGKWQYNSGSGWIDLPTAPSLTTPFLLSTADLVRFLPTANWNGTPGQLSARLIDSSSGAVTTGAGTDISGAATGGTSAYADFANQVNLGTTISAVNDAPLASGTATLTAINEDTTNPSGALVSALITGTQYSDATDTVSGGSTATALGGIAITANAANATTEGSWQYSTNGGTSWTTVPTSGLADSTALILPATAKLRFVPVADYAGTPGNLTVRLADSAKAFSASTDILGSLGTTNTWSAATAAIATVVNPVNDAPTIAALSGSPVTVEQQAAAVRLDADGVVTVFDKELGNNWNQSNLTVRRSGAAAASDIFSFIDDSATAGVGVETSGANLLVDGVTIGTFTNAGGSLVVTFNTSATAALVGKAMGAVAYRSTSDTPPATVQINFVLNDKNSNITGGGTNGGGQDQGAKGEFSAQSSVIVAITAINDAPTIAFLDSTRTGNYIENGLAIQIDSNAVVTDAELDATNWNKATLTVARNGGANADDVFGGTGVLSFTGTTSGNVVVSGVTVGTFTQSAGEIVITFNTNATAARADKVMQGLTYKNTSDDPPASVTLTYTVNDQNPNISGGGTAGTGVNQGNGGRLIATSNTTINITRVNDAPVLSVAPPAMAYTEQAAAVAVDSSITLTDVDDSNMASASVTISPGSFVSGDTLSVVTAGTGITASYNAGTGVLTLSGSDTSANYQQVLRSLSFSSTSDDPTLNTTRATRSLTIAVTDANSDGAGAKTTSTVRTLNLAPANDTPLLTGAGSTRSYTENAAAIALEPALSLTDVDDTQLDQAEIKIGTGFIAGDRLNFTNQSGISGSYNAATGVLTLTGAASFASYQTALRSVTFDSSSENPGSGARTVNWTVRDVNSDAAANGKQTSQAGTTTINVTPVNDDPVAQLDTNSLGKAATNPATGNVLANDSDIDAGTLTVSGLTGGVVGTPLIRPSGTLTVNPNGTYSFAVNASDPTVAALGAGATLLETYTYTISDGQGGTSTAQIRITINGANNAPVANPDSNNISEGTASISVAANGILGNDSDQNIDPLTVTGIINGANQPPGSVLPVSGGGTTATGAYGTLLANPNGSYTYTLNNSNPTVNALAVGQSLTDVFTYAISDGKGGTSTTNITITINGSNDGPVAINDTSSVPANAASVSGNALSNDSDPDTTDTLTVSAVNGVPASVGAPVTGTYGSVTVNANGSYIFTPNATTAKALAAGQAATDVFTYTISDGHGGTATATITINLTGTNDVPDAKADSNTITEDQATATGNVLIAPAR